MGKGKRIKPTEVKRKPDGYITEDQVRVIQVKEWLSLKEVALLLNVSPLTLRRWVLAGKMRSEKVGKKHLFEKRSLNNLLM
ncbi:helix-turn-helix domain-containing protein [Puia dinghuensis]|uniref:helix-turn-helix domain-containing protein n=1 Tax=Puia dinghuensis TaxID=1792502 RepID=UPI0016647C2A|nr:helix-turn-helix domain-containing protein [Puia dinghuensis]